MPERLHRDDAELGVGLERHALEIDLATDRGIDEVEEPEALFEASAQIDDAAPVWPGRRDREVETEPPEAEAEPIEDLHVLVRNAKRGGAVAFGVEDSGEEPLPPVVVRIARPRDDFGDPLVVGSGRSADRPYRAVPIGRGREGELPSVDELTDEEGARTVEGSEVGERQPEPVPDPSAVIGLVLVAGEVRVPPD